MTGLGLPDLFRGRAAAEPGTGAGPATSPGFGRARSCILIFQWGGPSQLDTWDPKPDAPDDVRGEFATIATSVPGVRISEHFPLLAAQAHRLAIIRSMTHDDFAHLSTAHRLLTGHLAPRPHSDADGPSPGDWPHLGALIAQLPTDAGGGADRRDDALDGARTRPPRGARPRASTAAGSARGSTRSASRGTPTRRASGSTGSDPPRG